MAGRNDVVIDAALEVVAQAMQNHHNVGGIDESRSLSIFQREIIPTFRAHKVRNDTYMLDGEAGDWWIDTRQRLEVVGETRRFAELVNSRRIYKEDNIDQLGHYKSLNEKRGKPHHDRKKRHDALAEKGKPKVFDWKKTSEGGAPAPIRCYMCGEQGHRSNECDNKVLRCYKCGKTDHRAPDCKDDGPTCFNYGEQGHISTQCQKPKKDANSAKTNGRVFALSGTENSKKDNLIQGTCFINGVELIAIIHTGATQSFISLDCATMLELKLSSIDGSMIIYTPASGTVTTTFVCLGCPLTIFSKSFVMDLLEFNYAHINCYNKTMRFPDFEDGGELMFLSANNFMKYKNILWDGLQEWENIPRLVP
ncbi:uncharacterized protein LOC131651045 [Vicia villosa]|uniref:uncharacterized protein LOC131651045 n=1 Tax=Vicia villosa TaxID=3911 RepID=UPI00273AE9F0|nr:uncharacterized protein LOC131651045 [Vicia villosa]